MVNQRGDKKLGVGMTIRVLQGVWKRFVKDADFLGILGGDEEERMKMS